MSQDSKDKSLNVLLTGNDERIDLIKGFTKHFINPSEVSEDINRGNCTCSGLSQTAEEVVLESALKIKKHGFNYCWENVRSSISALFKGENDVFIAPSGSHLSYFPLLFNVLVNPGQKITSIVSCSNELGSGTEKAYQGDSFFESNQFGEKYNGENISADVQSFHLKARDSFGKIVDNYKNIKELIERYNNDSKIVVNLSAGSKSGLKDDFSIIDEYPNVTWVVDACQYRIEQEVLNDLVGKGVLVFITGSKFYEAPPYCGAMIVKQSIGSRMNMALNEKDKPFFNEVFSQNDFPVRINKLRSCFKEFNNEGLLYKWEISLYNINRLNNYASSQVSNAISHWNAQVQEHIQHYKGFLNLMPTQKSDCKSILSFTLFNSNQVQLTFNQLNDLREFLAKDNCYQINDKNILIGQPVKYGNKAFIRIALGVNGVCDLLDGIEDVVLEKQILNMIIRILKDKF